MEFELKNNKAVWALFEAILQLRDREECARFFRDLCTVAELEAMAERWAVARLVASQMSYRQISEVTGASTATVTRVAHWLKYGEGGYRLMLERIKPQPDAEADTSDH
jgi:TrpR-related protein YerC/YecD